MRLTLDALETLHAIEEHGSFARAAEALHRVPSAVTYTIQKLEADLGVQLFDRKGKRAVLTEAGRAMLMRGRQLLRQAESLENYVRRVGDGWEPQLTLAVDEIVPLELLFPIINEFDAQQSGTQLQLTRETFSGAWDALVDRRADLSIGAAGDMPLGHGLGSRRWCSLPFVFAMAPGHPLTLLPEPLSLDQIVQHRAVVATDSARKLPPRSTGILDGQQALMVPSIGAKLSAQRAGLGVGFLPLYMARPHLEDGSLVMRQVEVPRPAAPLHIAWRGGDEGLALKWFRERILRDRELIDALGALEASRD